MLTINPIFPSVFEECHKIIDYNPFVVACEFDVCHMHINHIGCTSVQTYAEVCAEAGVCIDWRIATKGLCGMKLEYVYVNIKHCYTYTITLLTAMISTKKT